MTQCCPAFDTTGDGCYDDRLWFNPNSDKCEWPETFPTNCTIPVANISTTSTSTTTTTHIPFNTTILTTSSTTAGSTTSSTTITTASSSSTPSYWEISCPFKGSDSPEKKSEACAQRKHKCCHPLNESVATFNGVMTLVLAILGLIGNLLSTLAITSNLLRTDNQSTENSSTLLLLNLCVFDTLFCLVVMPQQAVGYFYMYLLCTCYVLVVNCTLFMYMYRVSLKKWDLCLELVLRCLEASDKKKFRV